MYKEHICEKVLEFQNPITFDWDEWHMVDGEGYWEQIIYCPYCGKKL